MINKQRAIVLSALTPVVLAGALFMTHVNKPHAALTTDTTTTKTSQAVPSSASTVAPATVNQPTTDTAQPATTPTTTPTTAVVPPSACTATDQNNLNIDRSNLAAIKQYIVDHSFNANYRFSDQQVLNNKIKDGLDLGCI